MGTNLAAYDAFLQSVLAGDNALLRPNAGKVTAAPALDFLEAVFTTREWFGNFLGAEIGDIGVKPVLASSNFTRANFGADELARAVYLMSLISNVWGKVAVPSRVYRVAVSSKPVRLGPTLYKHPTRPASSWSLENPTSAPWAKTIRKFRKRTSLKQLISPWEVVLETTEVRGKVVWTPESSGTLLEILHFTKDLEKRAYTGGYKSLGQYFGRLRIQLNGLSLELVKYEKEKEVVLYAPKGVHAVVLSSEPIEI